ncbi:RNA-directed DNA polymerase, eukaryota, reverse transcriptase zinc-binding domain protein [Tanacetum coccineum]
MEDGIFFNQSKYIKEMLKKFGLEDSKPTKTPMSTEIKLTKDDESDSVDNSKYRENPKTTHLEAVKRIFSKEEFGDIVKNHWGSVHEGCNMFRVVNNLKLLKRHFKDLAWKDGDIFEKVKELRNGLKETQTKIDKNPTDKDLRAEESKIQHEYNNAMGDEENFVYQKAKVKWLFVGDRNNAYFYRALKSRNHRNRINVIQDKEGKRYEGNEVVKLTQDEALSMTNDVSDAEIKRVMFQIDDNKAPSPDGFSSHFCKKAWDTIGGDICKAVKDLFHKGKVLSEINSTVIALCISKILTERMKKCLKKLVSQNQSAFIPNRKIQDNILISQELLKGYEKKGGPKRVSLKIDLQKAYDTVNWCFLEDILRGFGFHNKMVQWIMLCVTTTTFSINVNGESCGDFKGGRGLRQGDPISPYLFTLVMEILNLLMIRNIDNSGSFKYHFGCEQINITHVCFADDLLMFYHGDVESVKVIKETIEEFGTVSGLLPNYNKSAIIFGGVNEEDRQSILNVVPFRVEKLPVKYLGVSLVTKRIGVKDCKNLVDKVLYDYLERMCTPTQYLYDCLDQRGTPTHAPAGRPFSCDLGHHLSLFKVDGLHSTWSLCNVVFSILSCVMIDHYVAFPSFHHCWGVTLVASVLESIHVYWATIFLLPQAVINYINSLLKGFLWNQDERASGRAKVAWKSLCKPKTQGGLGLKDLGI